MKFYRSFLLLLMLFVISAGGMLFFLARYNQHDEVAYQKLISVDDTQVTKFESTKQLRSGLQKDIHFLKHEKHLQMRLKSDTAELTFDRSHGKYEIVEQMGNVICCLKDEDQEMEIAADQMDYDGRRMLLTGNVKADHHLGRLEADRAEIPAEINNKKLQYNTLNLDGTVKIDFSKGGSLSCSKAVLDHDLLSGKFYGDGSNEKVVYTDNLAGNNQEPIPLLFQSREMTILFAKADTKEGKSKTSISEMVGEGDVFINYNQDYTATTAKATYHPERGIETAEETVLVYKDTPYAHVLKCYGPVRVDLLKMETRIFSPIDANGFVHEDKQACFEDGKGKIYADRVLLKYQYNDDKLVPSKIVLVGNVRIFNRLTVTDLASATVLQYVLADRVEFTPLTKEMIFKSNSGKKVLFFDKVNDVRVSADSLKIIRDAATKKESIQGIGDVRFSFSDQEFERLQRKFSFGKSSPVTNAKPI